MAVSPWALTWDNENYYLVAFDDFNKICKHYRIDKMLKFEIIVWYVLGKVRFIGLMLWYTPFNKKTVLEKRSVFL